MLEILLVIFGIYFFPAIQLFSEISFLNTHTIALAVLIGLFLFISSNSLISIRRRYIFLLCLFIFCISLSILYTIGIVPFLTIYKDIIAAVIYAVCLYISLSHTSTKKIYSFILLLISLISLFELLYILLPQFKDSFNTFINSKTFIFSSFQENRGKYFESIYAEFFFPILLFYLISDAGFKKKIFIFIIAITQIYLAVVSGWRIKIAVIILSVILFTFYQIFIRKTHKRIISIFITALVIFFGLFFSQRYILNSQFNTQTTGFNPLDTESTYTLQGRLDMWREAITIGLAFPITGVGLGNYYDYSGAFSQYSKQSNRITNTNNFVRIQDPHNLLFSYFSMTGIVGTLSICLLLLFTLYAIVPIIQHRNGLLFVLYLCFINALLFGFLNPSMSKGFLIVLFFVITPIHRFMDDLTVAQLKK